MAKVKTLTDLIGTPTILSVLHNVPTRTTGQITDISIKHIEITNRQGKHQIQRKQIKDIIQGGVIKNEEPNNEDEVIYDLGDRDSMTQLPTPKTQEQFEQDNKKKLVQSRKDREKSKHKKILKELPKTSP